MATPIKPTIKGHWVERSNSNAAPEIYEKKGNDSKVMANARNKAIKLIKMDSPINRFTKEFFSAPRTFRMPTSVERFDERAVDKFMKLIQASRRVNKAMEPRIYKEVVLPTAEILLSIPEYRCICFKGIRNCFL